VFEHHLRGSRQESNRFGVLWHCGYAMWFAIFNWLGGTLLICIVCGAIVV
jgi:hypothetical protein